MGRGRGGGWGGWLDNKPSIGDDKYLDWNSHCYLRSRLNVCLLFGMSYQTFWMQKIGGGDERIQLPTIKFRWTNTNNDDRDGKRGRLQTTTTTIIINLMI